MKNELYHYGVLGMKWGVRRYQNKDGTLTAEGKRHYMSESPTVKEARASGVIANPYQRTAMNLKEQQDYNQQLRLDIETQRLEKELADYLHAKEQTVSEVKVAPKTNDGKKAAMKILGEVGSTVAKTALTGAALWAIYKVLGGNDFAKSLSTGKAVFPKNDGAKEDKKA